MTRLLRVVAVLLCFVLLVPGLAAAQQVDTDTETESDPTTPAANGTTTDTGNATGYSAGGGFGLSAPDPWEMTVDILTSAYESLRDGVASMVDQFNEIVMTLPAPGEPDDPGSWVAPPGEDTWWNAVWIIYWGLAGILIAPLFVFIVYSASRSDPVERRDGIRDGVKALVLITAGWLVIPLYLHTMNALALTFAPSGTEFMSSPEDVTRLGLGVLLGVILAVTKVGIIAVGLLVLLIQWVMVHILVALFPAFAIMQARPSSHLRSIGDIGIAALVFLGILKFVQAVTLRFLFELPITVDDPAASLFSFATTLVGIFIVLIAMPYWGADKVVPHSIVTGSTGATRMGEKIDRRRPSRHDIKERFTRSHTESDRNGSAPRASKRNGGSDANATTGRTRNRNRNANSGGRRSGRFRGARRSTRSGSGSGSGSARDLRDRRRSRSSESTRNQN